MPSKKIPINPHSSDPHDRYMMDSVETKVESRGNGIRTVIVNIAQIAKQIRFPPPHILTYFSYMLGVKSRTDAKNEKYILQGKFSDAELQKVVFQLVERWILCAKCKIPETEMNIKSEKITLTCRGCGFTRPADAKEKIYDYIVAHPPPKNRANENEKRGAKAAAMDDIESQFQNMSLKSGKQQQNGKEGDSNGVNGDDDDEEEWGADVSEDAVKQRQESLALKNGAAVKDDEEDEEEQVSPQHMVKQFLQERPDASPEKIIKKIVAIQSQFELSKKNTICLLYESLFDNKDTLLPAIKQRAPVFAHFLKSKTRPKLEMVILRYTEDFVAQHAAVLIPKMVKILEAFYNNDYVSEEVFLQWEELEKSKFVKDTKLFQKIKQAAKPFIEWLKSAEEDEDEE